MLALTMMSTNMADGSQQKHQWERNEQKRLLLERCCCCFLLQIRPIDSFFLAVFVTVSVWNKTI